jgi:hypothetical protein
MERIGRVWGWDWGWGGGEVRAPIGGDFNRLMVRCKYQDKIKRVGKA